MTLSAMPRVCAAGIAGAALLLFAACETAGPSRGLVIGDPLPPLAVTRPDGTAVTLDGFRGKVTVLNVWAVWCAPCRQELPNLDRLSRRLDPVRFQVVGLSVDRDRYLLQEFLRDHPLGFSVVQDTQRHVAHRLGVTRLPNTLLIAPDGTLAARVAGARAWDTPKVEELLQRLYEERRLAQQQLASALPQQGPATAAEARR